MIPGSGPVPDPTDGTPVYLGRRAEATRYTVGYLLIGQFRGVSICFDYESSDRFRRPNTLFTHHYLPYF
jgi:hypothetical protein